MKKGTITLFAALALASCGNNAEKSAETTSENADTKNAWTYEGWTDEMTNDSLYGAFNKADEHLEFEAPYDGGSDLELFINTTGGHNNIGLTISKGQFIPSFAGEKTMRVKFDDEAPVEWAYNSGAEAVTDVLFFADREKLIEKLKGAKKFMVEPHFYNEVEKAITFNVADLEWKH